MDTLPLDVSDLLRELDGDGVPARTDSAPAVAAGSRIGHVHLQVSELDAAERFYAGVLGFDVTVDTYPGALFVSAGGYHHHIGLNTWQTLGAPRPAPGSVGLRSFEVLLPDARALTDVLDRIDASGIDVAGVADNSAEPGSATPMLLQDPFGIAVVLRCA